MTDMTNATVTPARATLADLMRTEGKAELIGGKVVRFAPVGHRPSLLTGRIARRLADYSDVRGGEVFLWSLAFAVPELQSGRESFSPDVSYYTGPRPANHMSFVEGAPDFAVEVRSDTDYGPAAEQDMAAKRADYFQAGTKVVWDVDPEANVVRVYRADAPDRPVVYGRGQEAEAEPAVPGWRLPVDWLMAECGERLS